MSVIGPARAIENIYLKGRGWLGKPLEERLLALGYQMTEPSLSHLTILTWPPSAFKDNPEATLDQLWSTIGPQHLIYTSSISVFGDNQGEVNEMTEPHPTSESGKFQLYLENQMRERAKIKGVDLSILRSAGQYGPNRQPARHLSGRKDVANPNHPVNLVSLDDLIGLMVSLIENLDLVGTSQIFHAVHPSHPTREDHYGKVCHELGIPEPVFIASSGATGGKIVKAQKTQDLLGFKYQTDL